MKNSFKYAMTAVLFFGLIFSLNAQNVLKNEYHPNGKLKSVVTSFDQQLEVVNYYENGVMKERFYLTNLKRHGVFEAWYENGSRHMVVAYADNHPAGEWKVWSQEGSLIANAVFLNGKLQNGNMWDEEGNPIAYQE